MVQAGERRHDTLPTSMCVLESPVYAGAYAFGKTRRERYVDEHGHTRQRLRRLPQAEWGVLIWEHHPRLHRQGHVRGQPRTDRPQHPPTRAPGRRRGPRGQCAAPGNRSVQTLRAQAQGALSRPAWAPEPRLSLPRQHPGREPRQLVRASRRRTDRPGRRRRTARCAHPGRRQGGAAVAAITEFSSELITRIPQGGSA